MATFVIKDQAKNNGVINYKNDDEYMTPKYAWEQIKQFIPRNKIIWECFYGDGKSGEYLKQITGNEVIHTNTDFFECSVSFSILGVNNRFELLAFGLEADASTQQPVYIRK